LIILRPSAYTWPLAHAVRSFIPLPLFPLFPQAFLQRSYHQSPHLRSKLRNTKKAGSRLMGDLMEEFMIDQMPRGMALRVLSRAPMWLGSPYGDDEAKRTMVNAVFVDLKQVRISCIMTNFLEVYGSTPRMNGTYSVRLQHGYR
jgi:hypothetical protein